MPINGLSGGTAGVGSKGLVETSVGPDGAEIVKPPITIPSSAIEGGGATQGFPQILYSTWLRHETVLNIPINSNASAGNVVFNEGMFSFLSKAARLYILTHSRFMGTIQFRFTFVGASTLVGLYSIGTTTYYMPNVSNNDLKILQSDMTMSANDTNIYTTEIGNLIPSSGIPFAFRTVNPPGDYQNLSTDFLLQNNDMPHLVIIQNIPIASTIAGDLTSVQFTVETRLSPDFRCVIDNMSRLEYIYDTLVDTQSTMVSKAQGELNYTSLSEIFNRDELYIAKDGQFSYDADIIDTRQQYLGRGVQFFHSLPIRPDNDDHRDFVTRTGRTVFVYAESAEINGVYARYDTVNQTEFASVVVHEEGPVLFSIFFGGDGSYRGYLIFVNQFGDRQECIQNLNSKRFDNDYTGGCTFIQALAIALLEHRRDSNDLSTADLYAIFLSICTSYSISNIPADVSMRVLDGVVTSAEYSNLFSICSINKPAYGPNGFTPEYSVITQHAQTFDPQFTTQTLLPLALQLTIGSRTCALFMHFTFMADGGSDTTNTDVVKLIQMGPDYAIAYQINNTPQYSDYTYTITQTGLLNDQNIIKVPEEYVRIIFTENIPNNVSPAFAEDGYPTTQSLTPRFPLINDSEILVFDLYTRENKQTIMRIAYSGLYKTFFSRFSDRNDLYSVYNSRKAADLELRNVRTVSTGNAPDTSPFNNFLSRVVNLNDPHATYVVMGNHLSPKLSKLRVKNLMYRNG